MMQFKKAPVVTGEWECMECGYIEEGTESKRPRKCPECSAPANALEFFSYEDDADATWPREGQEDEFDDEEAEEDADVLDEDEDEDDGDEGWAP